MDLLTLYWLSVGLTLSLFLICFTKEAWEQGLDKNNSICGFIVVIASFIPLLNVSLIFNYLYSFYVDYKEMKEEESEEVN